MLTPAHIRLLPPATFEFLWRATLSRDHGASYRHVDGHGIDCLADDTAYQIYHHQGAAWGVVQGKCREDLVAAQKARAKGTFRFDEYVFITTFAFKDPEHHAWMERWRSKALPLRVVVWGDEQLCDRLARHPDLASQFGLGSSVRDQPATSSRDASAVSVELEPRATAMMERLLAAPGETLTLVDLRRQAGLDEPTSESDFKLLLHALTARGLAHVSEPPAPPALPPPESRPLSAGPIGVPGSGPAAATLLAAGKDYLVRERERAAARQAKRE